MGAEKCADGCGWRECNGVAGNGWEKKPLVMSELGCADGCGRQMGAEYPQVQEGLEWFAYRSKFSRSRMFFFFSLDLGQGSLKTF